MFVDASALGIALSAVEAVELRSLSWGFVDQSLDEGEAEAAIGAALAAADVNIDAVAVLDALVDAKMIRTLRSAGGRRYRSRIAELTRLLCRLRQWFDGQTWQAAPSLVSDFRIDIRPRRFPRRFIASAEALGQIDPKERLSPLQRDVWSALTVGGTSALAPFQVDATRRLLTAERGSATIVTAGTGSGKTLAFYLPAVVRVAPEIRRGDAWTKVVCLYPRQELLKDQLSSAFELASRAASALIGDGRRAITIGSLFGPTPFDATEEAVQRANWKKHGTGYICPFLRCPKCASEMVWRLDAIQRRVEVLECVKQACGAATAPGSLRLTRRRLQEEPPDFLFTTTEMMNQRLSDTRMRKVFGVGQEVARQPLMSLLDEAHTYAGISGAQTALLLRRWTALLGTKMRWAGLSATLPHAVQFFGDLTGTWVDNVSAIAPASADLVSQGAEYHLILRSDPTSQAATLSTSIQTIMLVARMMDRMDSEGATERFGSRTFVFTDDLDVTHRLYDNLLDAEAYAANRRPDPARTPLAALRESGQADDVEREREGQRWQMAEEFRNTLSSRLVIGRTTSRDPGVDGTADVVVATSALEVGFNDPSVGTVIQHKAPRSAASFLQRRGRAGRPQGMRPLTVIVLSDYGRDRVAFQSYEHLFDPMVETASLPIRNLYVLRMQAVYATLEWIAMLAPPGTAGWAWRSLAGPSEKPADAAFRVHAKDVLRRLMTFEQSTVEALRAHLQKALAVDRETMDLVLWHPPRALLLEALPTLARRLFRNWQFAADNGFDLHVENPPHPLPDYVPANLFSDLNLPEVQIVVPGSADAREAMPIVAALQQFAPGRVRRRFADARGNVSHWVPLDHTRPVQDIRIAEYASQCEFVTSVSMVRDGNAESVDVYRPWEVPLAVVPIAVSTTSNSQWEWHSDFESLGEPAYVALPETASVNEVIGRLELRLHRLGAAVSVRRFTCGGRAALRVSTQERLIQFSIKDDDGRTAAVGFAFEADALVARVRLPSAARLSELQLRPEMGRWLRYVAIKQRTKESVSLPIEVNAFRRDWLHQAVLLAGIVKAERDGSTLPVALQKLREASNSEDFTGAIAALISGSVSAEYGEDDAGDLDHPTRLQQTLVACIENPAVLEELLSTSLCWVSPTAEQWGHWLLDVAKATVAEAVLQACTTAVPQSAASEGLTVDILSTGDEHDVIVAETTLGGGGTLEALAECFSAEPRAFIRALEAACTPTDHELAADALRKIVSLAIADGEVKAALAELRAAENTRTREEARIRFFGLLGSRGVPVSRTLSVLVATRLLRPAADSLSDQVTFELLREWANLEQKHDIALPLRVAVGAVALTRPIRQRLSEMGGARREILTAALLLWPSSGELRQKSLVSYNPFRPEPSVDTAFVRSLLFDARMPVVVFGEVGWRDNLVDALGAYGTVRLTALSTDSGWRGSIAGLLSTPVVSGYLHFFPMIEAVRILESGQLAIDLLLRERV